MSWFSGWIPLSLFAMVGISLFFVSIPFFGKLGTPSGYVMLWWMLGTGIGMFCYYGERGSEGYFWHYLLLLIVLVGTVVVVAAKSGHFGFDGVALTILLLGVTYGTAVNLALGEASGMAPNPGFPLGIVNFNTVIVPVLAYFLGLYLREYYLDVTLSKQQLVGVVTAMVAIYLVVTG